MLFISVRWSRNTCEKEMELGPVGWRPRVYIIAHPCVPIAQSKAISIAKLKRKTPHILLISTNLNEVKLFCKGNLFFLSPDKQVW